MSSPKLESKNLNHLRSIRDLLTHGSSPDKFFIPSYQRGYRWGDDQVSQLLGDLAEFQERHARHDEHASDSGPPFYCLQPLVVKSLEGIPPSQKWEVIDGQQRLTTLFLLLTYLKSHPLTATRFESIPLYELSYETRASSGEFLSSNAFKSATDANANIDYHHMHKAYEKISEWFKKSGDDVIIQFAQFLLNSGLDPTARFIWYELPDTSAEAAVKAFIRLNVGKIPLTDAELIRALFLRARTGRDAQTFKPHQDQVSREWDEMEKALQADDFWFFLHSNQSPPINRIEHLFELVTSISRDNKQSNHPIFIHYERILNDLPTQEREWGKIRDCFMQLREWQADRELYHLIGFLIHNGTSMTTIRDINADQKKKSRFSKALRTKVFGTLFLKPKSEPKSDAPNKNNSPEETTASHIDDHVNGLSYTGSDRTAIRATLLFYNIAVLLANTHSTLRLPFHSYKNQDWDIEHVRSVTTASPEAVQECKEWLEMVKDYLIEDKTPNEIKPQKEDINNATQTSSKPSEEDQQLSRDIDALIKEEPFNHAKFMVLFSEIQRKLDGSIDKDSNGIGNLVLLDQTTNRSYKNAPFQIKRARILELDNGECFVPLSTRDVFLRRTSNIPHHQHYWEPKDMRDYKDHIVATLEKFFEEEKTA